MPPKPRRRRSSGADGQGGQLRAWPSGDGHVGSCREPGKTGTLAFDYLIDASGRGGVLANCYLKNRRFNEDFKNIAVLALLDQGGQPPLAGRKVPTGVFSLPGGWFWVIPLHDGTESVGLVTGRDSFNERRKVLGSNPGPSTTRPSRNAQASAPYSTVPGRSRGIRLEQDVLPRRDSQDPGI